LIIDFVAQIKNLSVIKSRRDEIIIAPGFNPG
jgi:hypothetical protein